MATSTTTTNFDPALKQLYKPENLADLNYDIRPFFGLLMKNEGFGGRNMPVVIKYGNPVGGRSAAFATAQSNRSHVRVEDFLLTRVSDYQIATIDSEVIEATRGDTYAFLSALKTKVDGSFAALSDAIESFLFRSGTGALAQIGSIAANDSGTSERITLLQTEEICNFEVDMVLVSSAADGGALRATPASSTIASVDRSAGTFLVGDLTAGTDWAANDFLYVQGDAAAAGSNVKISGLAAWLPATVTSTSFFGVDRTTESRLAGLVHTGTGDTLEDVGIDAQSKVGREGGKPDLWLMHNAQYRRLVKELGAKKVYTDVMARYGAGNVANIGYRGVVIEGDYGPIHCVPANKCQATLSWMLSSDAWKLHTLGPATKFLMEDGLRILRQSNADGYEVRMVFRGNLACKAPIHNARVSMPNP
jgi:hypothetical protein